MKTASWVILTIMGVLVVLFSLVSAWWAYGGGNSERVNDCETPRGRNLVLRRVDGRGDRGIGPGAVSAANLVDPQVVLGPLR